MESFFNIGLIHFLVVSFLLLAAGIATMLSKRNAIGILIGVELVLNAASINLVAFNHYGWPYSSEAAIAAPSSPSVAAQPDDANAQGTPPDVVAPRPRAIDGQMFAIFIIVLAAAEAAMALGIFLNFYNNFSSIDVERADQLRG